MAKDAVAKVWTIKPSANGKRYSAYPAGDYGTYLASSLSAQKETEGVADFSAAVSVGAAGQTLLSWVGVRTALFVGPVIGNNSNTHVEQFSQAYGNGFTNYTLRGYRCYNAAGSSNHSVTGTKSTAVTEEVTVALVALSGGTIVSSSITQQVNAGAGHTFTSGSVTLTAPGILVAVCSGDGNVNATAPTQTWPAEWTVVQSVAYSSAQAPNGHIPLYVAYRAVAAGSYTVGVTVAIDEGVTLAIYGVQ